MRPIGFSTGALAKGDFALGLEKQREVPGIQAVELSALRGHELPALVDAIDSLDLGGFEYVSVHAPSKLPAADEEGAFHLLLRVPDPWPIIVHPELLLTPALWRRLGDRLCIENMDDRKATGRTVSELRTLFDAFPEATFCLDLGHARQIDPTMTSAILMLREFGHRLRQLHVSDVGPHGEHLPLGAAARNSFARVARLVPDDCPVIIESIIDIDAIERELDTVIAVFEAPLKQATA
ncbi:MAG: hypothetical protein QOC81_1367 [Thermoanaerobaculia bacterium]|jgi:hypothetical protein|nr:hypothetical protein [Thermoanaerobaculia bacterium]